MTLTEEQLQTAWAKWNEANDTTLHRGSPEQILQWLEGMRELMFELWKNDPAYRKNFETERFSTMKHWLPLP